jgi:two-component system response regulator
MSQHGSILLVEDNPDDVELTLLAFRDAGIANPITVARDGVEALDVVFARGAHKERTPADFPALILLDLKLPRLGGIEVLQILRDDERTRLVPVVVLTTSNEDRDVVESYRIGANSYVRKPVDFNEFNEAVRQLGLYWLLMNHPAPLPRT